MKSKLITTIPVWNGEDFILQTLQSVAAQTMKPSRVIVIDNGSTDRTEEIVKNFEGIRCEWIRNPTNIGLFGNFNRCLDFADQTDYLQILHADDMLHPEFYEVMTQVLADCAGRGMAWCLDERIDENNQTLSVSGKTDAKAEVLDLDTFLRRKAEIGNQAFCATLLKTCNQPLPIRFPMDMPILGDMAYWAQYGMHCKKIVHLHRPLAKYRWHGTNATTVTAPNIQALILDEWRVMEMNECLRQNAWGFIRTLKLKGLFAVRSGIKAKRIRKRQTNVAYSKEIVRVVKRITGTPLWLAAQVLVELRDLVVYTILRRPQHPKNIFS
jgi:glycosyltransferase involved in cell wall biosynthesis